jgi:hypothetical protein
MPPRLPPPRSSEVLCYGVAGLGAFAPLYFLLPGVKERLAIQTARWAPRWERNITYIVPPIERAIKMVEPPVSKMVRHIDSRLPLEKVAKGIDCRIRKGIERIGKH